MTKKKDYITNEDIDESKARIIEGELVHSNNASFLTNIFKTCLFSLKDIDNLREEVTEYSDKLYKTIIVFKKESRRDGIKIKNLIKTQCKKERKICVTNLKKTRECLSMKEHLVLLNDFLDCHLEGVKDIKLTSSELAEGGYRPVNLYTNDLQFSSQLIKLQFMFKLIECDKNVLEGR